MNKKSLLASVIATVGLTVVTVSPAFAAAQPPTSAAAPELRPVECNENLSTVSASGVADGRGGIGGMELGVKVTVTSNPCSRGVRARVHCDTFLAGTYYEWGSVISGLGSSSAYCSGGNVRYGKQGWEEYYRGSWHFHEVTIR